VYVNNLGEESEGHLRAAYEATTSDCSPSRTHMTQRTSSEVDDGCRKLFQDIASGRIVDLIAGYQRAQRDYLFVVGAKERR
jgi:hypothetical protein